MERFDGPSRRNSLFNTKYGRGNENEDVGVSIRELIKIARENEFGREISRESSQSSSLTIRNTEDEWKTKT